MAKPKPLPPVTMNERACAAIAAKAIRAAIADPSSAGERGHVHLLLSNPRRGLWMVTFANVPGLLLDPARRTYTHRLLPGWEYTVSELRGEMIDDLEQLARHGIRPTQASRS